MFLLKVLAFAFVMAFVFGNAESRYLDPRFKGMIMKKSFDEASGKIIFLQHFVLMLWDETVAV